MNWKKSYKKVRIFFLFASWKFDNFNIYAIWLAWLFLIGLFDTKINNTEINNIKIIFYLGINNLLIDII